MITITVTEDRDLLGRAIAGRDDLQPALEMSLAAGRALIREEFVVGAWRPQSGPMRPWAQTRAGNHPLGGASSSLALPYLGEGPGAVEEFTENSVTFGSAHVAAGVHRGVGSVRAADARIPHRQKMTRRQAAYLAIRAREEGRTFGERPKGHPDRGYIVTPRRPHATPNPEWSTRITAIFSAHVRGVEVPPELLTEGGLR